MINQTCINTHFQLVEVVVTWENHNVRYVSLTYGDGQKDERKDGELLKGVTLGKHIVKAIKFEYY